ncbi:unnamed protein product [Cuscuta europaea]|uniref:Uncharacterized protein n=1 Tax=Cuscuta europaea TaxID=41803 RepID=A0A9P0ZN07_CUSEU|nr:unnamed protein product [Cuscuta europaea]
MAVKLIFSRLPGGGYVPLRGGYSNLDLLAAVCVADSEMEQNRLHNVSSSSSPNSVIPRNKRSSRRRISDSALKCVVSAFKRLSVGNKNKRTARKIKKRVHPQPAAGEAGPMPGRFRDGIRQLAGPGAEIAEENLLIEKEITESDLRRNQGRLTLPVKSMRLTAFLTAEEEMRLATRQNKKVGSLDDVALIAAIGGKIVKSEVSLRRWEMRKKSGKASVSFILARTWNQLQKSLRLTVGSKVQIWSVRVDGRLWLSLVQLPPM